MDDQSGWVRRAVRLSWFTIAYNLIEGTASIGFGIKDEALSLAGFGADSFIEVASAFVVLWRFRRETQNDDSMSLEAEPEATLAIGALFLALALAAGAASIWRLATYGRPDTTVPGFVISLVSLSFMFYLWSAKRKAGRALDSATVMKDAACSLACIQLSFVLLAGSLLHMFFPNLWWADASAAVLIAALIAREGWGTIRAARSPDFKGGCSCC